jgi:large-conductance mechanosensitive channel
MKNLFNKKSSQTESLSLPKLVLGVVLGTEAFHAVNSIKLNLILPTLSNFFHESTVRSWQFGWHSVCLRYGNVLWDMASVAVYVTVVYVLWRFVAKRYFKNWL